MPAPARTAGASFRNSRNRGDSCGFPAALRKTFVKAGVARITLPVKEVTSS
jgi:hypothetical protein